MSDIQVPKGLWVVGDILLQTSAVLTTRRAVVNMSSKSRSQGIALAQNSFTGMAPLSWKRSSARGGGVRSADLAGRALRPAVQIVDRLGREVAFTI
jgi:hypothetical protein